MDNEILKTAADKGPLWSLLGIGAAWVFSVVKRWLGLEKKDANWEALEQTRAWVDDVKKDVTVNAHNIGLLTGRVDTLEKSADRNEEWKNRIEGKIDTGFTDLRNLLMRHIEKER